MGKSNKVLFLYGKLAKKAKAVCYCNLHKCYISKHNLIEKRFKCTKCKYKEEVENI